VESITCAARPSSDELLDPASASRRARSWRSPRGGGPEQGGRTSPSC